MTVLNIQISEKAQTFAAEEAAKRGLPDAGAYISVLLEETAGKNGSRSPQTTPPVAEFFQSKSLDQIIAEQGVKPITDISILYGDFWPEDENLDDFLAAVKEWRRGNKSENHE